jgi:hypothetical protein
MVWRRALLLYHDEVHPRARWPGGDGGVVSAGRVCGYFSVVVMLPWPQPLSDGLRSAPPASSHEASHTKTSSKTITPRGRAEVMVTGWHAAVAGLAAMSTGQWRTRQQLRVRSDGERHPSSCLPLMGAGWTGSR